MELQGEGIDMFCRLTSAQVDQLGDNYEIYEGEKEHGRTK